MTLAAGLAVLLTALAPAAFLGSEPAPASGPAKTDETVSAGEAREDEPPERRVALRPVWTARLGGSVNHPPAVDGGRVFAASQADVLYALDLRTGRKLWGFRPEQGHLWDGSVTAGAGMVLVGVQGGHLLALDQATGRLLWRRRLHGEAKFRAVPAGDVLYVATTFAGERMERDPSGKARVYALKVSDGSVLWEYKTDNFALREPFLFNGTIFAGGAFESGKPTEDGEGGWTRLYALRARSGSLKWIWEAPDGFVKSIHAAGNVVAYVGYSDAVQGLSADDGHPLWRYHSENWTHGFLGVGDRLYFGSANGFVHAVDVETGRALWKYDQYGVFNYVVGAPAMMNGTLYYRTTNQEIWALDAAGGDLLWWGPAGAESRGALGAAEGKLFLGGADGVLYVYDGMPAHRDAPRR